MVDTLWARGVLYDEGVTGRRVVIQSVMSEAGAVSEDTGEIVLWEGWGHGDVLHEIAHVVAGTRDKHSALWQIAYAKLVNKYTIPVSYGLLGLEGE